MLFSSLSLSRWWVWVLLLSWHGVKADFVWILTFHLVHSCPWPRDDDLPLRITASKWTNYRMVSSVFRVWLTMRCAITSMQHYGGIVSVQTAFCNPCQVTIQSYIFKLFVKFSPMKMTILMTASSDLWSLVVMVMLRWYRCTSNHKNRIVGHHGKIVLGKKWRNLAVVTLDRNADVRRILKTYCSLEFKLTHLVLMPVLSFSHPCINVYFISSEMWRTQ